MPIEMFVADSQQNGCHKKATSNAAATSHLWLKQSQERERERKKGGEMGGRAGCAASAVQRLQLCLLSTSCGPRSVFAVCLSRSLPRSLSRSRLGNFSFVITVSVVDVAMTGKLLSAYAKERERASEGGRWKADGSRLTTQFN